MNSADVAWLHEQTRMFDEAQCGSRKRDAVWEALLAEAETDLLPWLDEATGQTSGPTSAEPLDRDGLDRHGSVDGQMPGLDRRDDESGSSDGQTSGPTSAEAPLAPELPDAAAEGPADLDRRCVRLARELALRELRVADLTLELKTLTGYDGMTEPEFAEQVLGMSHSWLKAKHTLVRRLGRLPELRAALEDGRIGMEAAGLVARIATQQSVEAWVERAGRRRAAPTIPTTSAACAPGATCRASTPSASSAPSPRRRACNGRRRCSTSKAARCAGAGRFEGMASRVANPPA